MKLRYTTLFFCTALLAGCRSPHDYAREADTVAADVIAQYQQEALGRTEPFTIERPSDALRRRLMAGQNLPGEVQSYATNSVPPPLPDPLKLTLVQALQVGARNSREYQAKKEEVFSKALALDLKRDAFRNTYSGLVSALFSADHSGDTTRTVDGDLSASISRTLKSGASLTSKLALDLSRLLTGDRSSTLGLIADATISIPLLGGSGREVNTEALTQAERNVIYALWEFERYKRTFAVALFKDYFAVLERFEQIRNAQDNYNRIRNARERAAKLAEAGRLPETQVDQARQDELSARNRIISAEQTYENQLDAFKITLGLPADARVDLDMDELNRQARGVRRDLAPEGGETTNTVSLIAEADATATALENRLDLRIVGGALVDAERQVRIARDALRATADLELAASTTEQSTSGGEEDVADIHFADGDYSVGLDLDLPWERTSERNAYRSAFISRDAALRALEAKEDAIKLNIRTLLRALTEAREVYRIQLEAARLAERRIHSTELFLEAGRSEIRDLLEAQEALIDARNDLTSTQISYRLALLNLERDMGTLKVNEKGLWREKE